MKIVVIIFLVIIFLIIFIEPARNYINNLLVNHQDNLQAELKEKDIIGYTLGRNPKVEEIQNILKYAGFKPGPVDGHMGAQTRMAIRKFQKSKGLKVTGRIDSITWSALNKKQESEKSASGMISKIHLPSLEVAETETEKKLNIQDEIMSHRLKSIDRIKKIQQALKNAGFYKGDIDGKIGPKTKMAIKAFQKSKGLIADGVVGQKTWDELSKYFKD